MNPIEHAIARAEEAAQRAELRYHQAADALEAARQQSYNADMRLQLLEKMAAFGVVTIDYELRS